jgi:hypothetical protein
MATAAIAATQLLTNDLFEFDLVSVDLRDADLFFETGDAFAIALSAPTAPVSAVSSA